MVLQDIQRVRNWTSVTFEGEMMTVHCSGEDEVIRCSGMSAKGASHEHQDEKK